MSTHSVPNNQPIEWYQKAIDSYGRGNEGEGKDYDLQELEQVYFAKCRKRDDQLADELLSMSEELLEELPPRLPLIPIAKFDILFDKQIKEFIMVPEVINDFSNLL